ncbi:MAG: hypothetical protein DBW62_08640 [Microbacterium sp.]|nr:MAG: hypothetical protein DBW62_08640 [Microbacterium sp.]
MPSGGSRIGAGRPPQEGSLAEAIRLESGLIRTLPKERTGPTPKWPLRGRARAGEAALWAEMWRKPQAIVWEEEGNHHQVAMHVRTHIEAEAVGATAALRGLLLRQQSDLLLTRAALLKAGFRISTSSTPNPAGTPVGGPTQAKRKTIPSARGRLRAVEDVGSDS